MNLHPVGKLRTDANLKFLYDRPQKRRGRPRRFAGKVDLTSPGSFEFVTSIGEDIQLYTARVWSVCFQRPVRLAYLLKTHKGQQSYAVLFSTDLDLSSLDIYRFYTARFQIKFIFRSARQFTGLAHCQARSPQALDSHVNASFTALNLAKVALPQHSCITEPLHFSIASYKRLA